MLKMTTFTLVDHPIEKPLLPVMKAASNDIATIDKLLGDLMRVSRL